MCIEYQSLAGATQRQAKGRGINIELKCGGSGSMAQLVVDLSPREVSA